MKTVTHRRHFSVVVVGAGPSGIGAAKVLRDEGIDFVVLEKASRLGGTWRDNTYPGCACDVPSALYSYSFAQSPEWSRAFAGQAEILAYLEHVAERFDLVRHVRFDTALVEARYSPRDRRWHLDTSRGPMSADVLVTAAGPWHEPLVPTIEGRENFSGEAFHSARWRHDVDLEGKRVAVVGSGASAVQFVPEIAKKAARLHLYQRTAQWVLPKPDVTVPAPMQGVLRAFPKAREALRGAEYAAMEAFGLGFRHPWLMEQVQRIGKAHLRRSVTDPTLRKKLTPDYTLGCKRLLMSNTYYPALTRPNVEVHAAEVTRVDGPRVHASDGTTSEVDVIVYGTGFRILDMPIAHHLKDAEGATLASRWKGSPRAYLGTTVAGLPNLFVLLGPSLGTGHSSAFTILEAQLGYMTSALRAMRRGRLATIEVRREVMDRYFDEVQRAVRRTVYVQGGCGSYYLDENGKNTFSWPWSTPALEARLARFDLDDYRTERETTVAAHATGSYA